MVDDACKCVPELAIPADLPVAEQIHKLATTVCEARAETIKVQLELNFQIAKLQLKAHHSTPPKVIEKRASVIKIGLEEIGPAVQDYTEMLEQAFVVLTSLQEDPNIQCLETEARKPQEQYDSV